MDAIVISGGKGGVGKSFVAACVAGVLDQAGLDHYIVDADFRTADVCARYPNNSVKLDLAAEKGWNSLGDVLLSEVAPVGVVNLGADVTDVDSVFAADAARVFAGLGKVTLIWVLTPTPESLRHLVDSVERGVMRHGDMRRIVALNLLTDTIKAVDFGDYQSSEARKTLLAGGAIEVVIPNLYRDYVAATREKPLSILLESRIDGLNPFGCMRAKKWFELMAGELGSALEIGVEKATDPAGGKANGKRK